MLLSCQKYNITKNHVEMSYIPMLREDRSYKGENVTSSFLPNDVCNELLRD